MRLIDRSIRPLFPDGFKQEVQVLSRVFGYDGEHSADILAMIAGFASLHISNIPFHGALAAVRVGHLDGKLMLMPSDTERRVESNLDLVLAGHQDAIVMVEASAQRAARGGDDRRARDGARRPSARSSRPSRSCARRPASPSSTSPLPSRTPPWRPTWRATSDALRQAMGTEGKHERYAACDAVRDECVAAGDGRHRGRASSRTRTKAVKNAFHDLNGTVEREMILSGTPHRRSARATRSATSPSCPTSSRGTTARRSSRAARPRPWSPARSARRTTRRSSTASRTSTKKSFYLHYNFPPYSVGETRRIMGPGRREIGHGMLAERALAPVLPDNEKFPYTVRIVSEITESNGSSSMASVCGGCLSMMSAGVPISQPVAGIAMGLIEEGDAAGDPVRHPRLRGPQRRHGLQGGRLGARHHRAPDGHQDQGRHARAARARPGAGAPEGASTSCARCSRPCRSRAPRCPTTRPPWSDQDPRRPHRLPDRPRRQDHQGPAGAVQGARSPSSATRAT